MRSEAPIQHFGPTEWGMSAAIAVVWGSSFLWIAIAIDWVEAPVVPLFRCLFGALAIVCIPAARRRIARADVPRFVFLGLCWMAAPFLLYPLAEQTVNTSITGMLNGGLPLVTVVVTAFYTRHRPSRFRIAAVLVGFAGIALISFASVDSGDSSKSSADTKGIVLLLVALVLYAIAANAARPVQAKYGALPTMLWIEIFGAAWSLPWGLASLPDSTMSWQAVGALLVLGAVGTGLAFALYGVLLMRAGTVRGMIGIFFTPIVGTILGVLVRDDELHLLAIAGMAIVIVGAVMTSRPEPISTN